MLDTLVFEPDAERFSMVWRASLKLQRDIFELSQAVVGRMSRAWWRSVNAWVKSYSRSARYRAANGMRRRTRDAGAAACRAGRGAGVGRRSCRGGAARRSAAASTISRRRGSSAATASVGRQRGRAGRAMASEPTSSRSWRHARSRSASRRRRTKSRSNIPVLLCIAEPERPGRFSDIDACAAARYRAGAGVSAASAFAGDRAGPRRLGRSHCCRRGADCWKDCARALSLRAWIPFLRARRWRRMTGRSLADAPQFEWLYPRRGAARRCCSASRPESAAAPLLLRGLGFAREPAPSVRQTAARRRAGGRQSALRLTMRGSALADCDHRIADMNGEQYSLQGGGAGDHPAAARAQGELLAVASGELHRRGRCSDIAGDAGNAVWPAHRRSICPDRFARASWQR